MKGNMGRDRLPCRPLQKPGTNPLPAQGIHMQADGVEGEDSEDLS